MFTPKAMNAHCSDIVSLKKPAHISHRIIISSAIRPCMFPATTNAAPYLQERSSELFELGANVGSGRMLPNGMSSVSPTFSCRSCARTTASLKTGFCMVYIPEHPVSASQCAVLHVDWFVLEWQPEHIGSVRTAAHTSFQVDGPSCVHVRTRSDSGWTLPVATGYAGAVSCIHMAKSPEKAVLLQVQSLPSFPSPSSSCSSVVLTFALMLPFRMKRSWNTELKNKTILQSMKAIVYSTKV